MYVSGFVKPQDRPLDDLVRLYVDNPGAAESEQLEFKAKEKVETTEGKRDITRIASAVANSSGGTIVIGVGEGDREDIIQSFDSRSEIKRDLAHVFRDLTKPSLDRLTTINLEQISSGPRLLRIDIEAASTHPIEFKSPDMDEYTPFHRVEDTTRLMGTDDIVEFTNRRGQSSGTEHHGIETSISVDSSKLNVQADPQPRQEPANRAVIKVNRLGLIIPSRTPLSNPFQKSVTFHVETRAKKPGLDGVRDLLGRAEEDLGADLGFGFGYGIKYRDQELIGRTANSYLDDLENLEETLQILGWEGESDPRPIAIGATSSEYGMFWVQVQYHTGSYSRVKCGVQMGDIPLHTEPLSNFFGERWLSQQRRLQEVRVNLRGDEVALEGAREELLAEDDREARTEVIAANPYYRNADVLREAAEDTIPESFIEMLCSVNRLPYDVRAGYRDDDVYHTAAEVHLNYIDAIAPTYTVWPMCDPHQEAPDEEPPTPDWLPSSDDKAEGNGKE